MDVAQEGVRYLKSFLIIIVIAIFNFLKGTLVGTRRWPWNNRWSLSRWESACCLNCLSFLIYPIHSECGGWRFCILCFLLFCWSSFFALNLYAVIDETTINSPYSFKKLTLFCSSFDFSGSRSQQSTDYDWGRARQWNSGKFYIQQFSLYSRCYDSREIGHFHLSHNEIYLKKKNISSNHIFCWFMIEHKLN